MCTKFEPVKGKNVTKVSGNLLVCVWQSSMFAIAYN